MTNRLLLFLFALGFAASSNAQVLFADTTGMGDLKKTTTLFLLPDMSADAEQDYTAAITDAWHLTPFKIIHPKDMPHYIDKPGYSYMCEVYFGDAALLEPRNAYNRTIAAICPVPDSLNGDNVLLQIPKNVALEAYVRAGAAHIRTPYGYRGGDLAHIPHGFYAAYALLMPPRAGDEQRLFRTYALVQMGPAGAYSSYVKSPMDTGDDKWVNKNDAQDDNPRWNAGLVKTYINVVNSYFAKGTFPHHPVNYVDAGAMARLKTDTLYFCDGPVRSLAPDLPALSDTGLVRIYPYPMRVVTQLQLLQLILHSSKPVNYVAHYPLSEAVKVYKEDKKTTMYGNVTYKQVNIYNSEKGIIYAHFPTDHSMLLGKKRDAAPKFSVSDVEDIAAGMKGEME